MATILLDIPAAAHGTAPHGVGDLWHAWHADPLITVPLTASCLLFFRGVLRLHRDLGRFPPGFGMMQIVCFSLGVMLLVIALLSPREALYHPPDTSEWGLTALEDQQLAGAIISLSMCAIYLAAGLMMALRLLMPGTERTQGSSVASAKLLKPTR